MSHDADQDDRFEHTNRRRFLKGLGALSVVGLAGCGGDGDVTDTPTSTDTEADDTPTDSPTDTPTDTETDTPTDTATATPVFTGDPAQLISFSGSVQVAPGETVSVMGTIQNAYLFAVTNGEFTLAAPNDDWSVSAVSGNTFDSLESQSTQDAEWEVTAPGSASGSFELSVSGTYQGPNEEETAEVSTTLSILVRAPGQAPIGLDCGGGHFDEVPEIDGVPFLPSEDQRANIEYGSTNVQPVPEGDRWWTETGNATVEPAPNAATNTSVTEIEGTDADILYRSEWWSTDQFAVTIDIENGTYDVILHLAEITYPDEEGARVFGATVNGETAFEELDLTAEVGGATAATRAVEGLEVTDNTITIDVESSVENPKLSGIEIREA